MSLAEALSAKVLVYDCETRPMASFHWAARDQNISPAQVLDSGGVLCWAAKWLHESKVRFASDHHDGHEAMVAGIHKLLDAADIVIGYNQVSFDDRRMAVEFRRCGLPVPSPVRSLDLLKAVRSRFGFPINKLQSVAVELGVGSKLNHTGWDLWRQCITDENGQPYLGPTPLGGGSARHWKRMAQYCRQDVKLTEAVYYKLREGGWIKNHPHLGLFDGNVTGCGTCGGKLIAAGTTPTPTATFQLWRCETCGTLARGLNRTTPTTPTRSVA